MSRSDIRRGLAVIVKAITNYKKIIKSMPKIKHLEESIYLVSLGSNEFLTIALLFLEQNWSIELKVKQFSNTVSLRSVDF